MKSLLSCTLILFCTTVFAQQKDGNVKVLPKIDTTKASYFKDRKKEVPTDISKDHNEPYKILTVKPDTSAYMALKEAKKDNSQYKILNTGTIPEKTETDTKKATPSK
ncbi:hypothetical protein B0A69_12510 [Chryseobacterium shigense]|nr:hypothetical protein [Chryseobacterium shigense]PQA92981.1 hypothetical protein B0A69_12510 [Chryseobacterium shigense]